jgi:hypothetical protein
VIIPRPLDALFFRRTIVFTFNPYAGLRSHQEEATWIDTPGRSKIHHGPLTWLLCKIDAGCLTKEETKELSRSSPSVAASLPIVIVSCKMHHQWRHMSETNSTVVSIRSNNRHGLQQEEQSVSMSASTSLSISLSMSLSMSMSVIMSAPLTTMNIPTNIMSLSMPAMCSFCPGGNANPELVQPKEESGHLFHGAGLCTPLWRRAFVETNPTGKMVILAKALCCPPAVTITDVKICSFCPAGLTNPDLVLPTPDQDTCTDTMRAHVG